MRGKHEGLHGKHEGLLRKHAGDNILPRKRIGLYGDNTHIGGHNMKIIIAIIDIMVLIMILVGIAKI